MGSRMVHLNIKQRRMFCDAESEISATDLSKINAAAGNEALAFRRRSNNDKLAENIGLPFKLNALKLKVEEL